MKEYGVSLRKWSKWVAISKIQSIVRIIEFLKNVWRVSYLFGSKFVCEISIINEDQMPLHRSKSTSLSFTRVYFCKRKLYVFTQVSCKKSNPLPLPEIVFKEKGACIKLCHSQWIKSHLAPQRDPIGFRQCSKTSQIYPIDTTCSPRVITSLIYFYFFNWDSPHARLNSHCEAYFRWLFSPYYRRS